MCSAGSKCELIIHRPQPPESTIAFRCSRHLPSGLQQHPALAVIFEVILIRVLKTGHLQLDDNVTGRFDANNS